MFSYRVGAFGWKLAARLGFTKRNTAAPEIGAAE